MQTFYNSLICKQPDNGILFHYTDQSGLCGIIKNKNIWASNIYYLNDSAEFTAASDLAKEHIDRRKKTAKKNQSTILDAIGSGVVQSIGMNVFVCSFSGKGDQLGQWRGYCNGGAGFSIGFSYDFLNDRAKLSNVILGRCIYNKKQHIELINEMIDSLISDFETKFNGTDMEHRFIRFKGHAGAKFTKCAPLIKNNNFRTEDEWRLITRPMPFSDSFKYRAGKSMLTPYFEFQLVKDPHDALEIKKVIVGPCPHIDLSINSVTGLLKSNSCVSAFVPFDDPICTDVVKSKIPFRNW